MPRITGDDWNLLSAVADAGMALQALTRLSPDHPGAALVGEARELFERLTAIRLEHIGGGVESHADDAEVDGTDGDDTDAGESNDATA